MTADLMFEEQTSDFALDRAERRPGRRIAMRMPVIPTTTSVSISVKPEPREARAESALHLASLGSA
jgi:hypothetical protein